MQSTRLSAKGHSYAPQVDVNGKERFLFYVWLTFRGRSFKQLAHLKRHAASVHDQGPPAKRSYAQVVAPAPQVAVEQPATESTVYENISYEEYTTYATNNGASFNCN